MPQIQAPVNYVNGQTVDATGFNNHVNGAIVLPGIITDFANITANTVASNDSILLYDLSALALKEANVSDVLNSNLAITTSSITGGPASNLVITPAVGFLMTVSTGGTFGGNLSTTGTLSSTGAATIGGNLTVSGTTATLPAVTATTVTTTGNATVGGNLTVTGTITQSGGIASKILYEIVEYTISDVTGSGTISAPGTCYTTPSLTKPAGEIWIFEFSGHCLWADKIWYNGDFDYYAPDYATFRIVNSTSSVAYFTTIISNTGFTTSATTGADPGGGTRPSETLQYVNFTYVSPTTETFTSTIQIRTNATSVGKSSTSGTNVGSTINITPGKLTILKYKA